MKFAKRPTRASRLMLMSCTFRLETLNEPAERSPPTLRLPLIRPWRLTCRSAPTVSLPLTVRLPPKLPVLLTFSVLRSVVGPTTVNWPRGMVTPPEAFSRISSSPSLLMPMSRTVFSPPCE